MAICGICGIGGNKVVNVIREGDLLLVTDAHGNVPRSTGGRWGLYLKDTRFLNQLQWFLKDAPLQCLSANMKDGICFYHYTHDKGIQTDGEALERDTVEINRKQWIHNDILYETYVLTNRGRHTVSSSLKFMFDADFADTSVIQGGLQGDWGEQDPEQRTEEGIVFTYYGSDNVKRSMEIQIRPAPDQGDKEKSLTLSLRLEPRESQRIHLRFFPRVDDGITEVEGEKDSLETIRHSYRKWLDDAPKLFTNCKELQALYQQGLKDLRLLSADLGEGCFPVSGLPARGFPTGRDALMAGYFSLPFRVETAKSVIRTLVRYQGMETDSFRGEEPGKIMQEIRFGECAETGRIPHTPSYEAVDTTPLFLLLIAEVYQWTGDISFVRECLPYAHRAWKWLEVYGDPDGRGYIAHRPAPDQAVFHQGWKSSEDVAVHEDGRLAHLPISWSEVQGYVYMAKQSWVDLYEAIGNHEEAKRLKKEAEKLKRRFRKDFWMEDVSYPAMALDYAKKHLAVISSNPGHCLLAGLFDPDEATTVTKRLMKSDMNSGWGIRTLSKKASFYNPLSPHHGSVWPWENAWILMGMKGYGLEQEAGELIRNILDAAAQFRDCRLPEWFCGYSREEGGIVPHPEASSIHAGAAGVGFAVLKAILGIRPDVVRRHLHLRPALPSGADHLSLCSLLIGKGTVDIHLFRNGEATSVQMDANTTGWIILLES